MVVGFGRIAMRPYVMILTFFIVRAVGVSAGAPYYIYGCTLLYIQVHLIIYSGAPYYIYVYILLQVGVSVESRAVVAEELLALVE